MDATTISNKTKKCEHCEKDINAMYRTCPICGGNQSENKVPLPPECPRCKVPLKIQVCDREEYDICPECGGLWLDRVEFHRATTSHTVFNKHYEESEYQRPPLRNAVQYVSCVRCGKLMNRRNFGRISGVIIDRCRKHGVWLDAGELEKIQHFIADGGLDRARDRLIEKNRSRIKDLANSVNQVDFTQKLIHFWNFKRWLFRGWR